MEGEEESRHGGLLLLLFAFGLAFFHISTDKQSGWSPCVTSNDAPRRRRRRGKREYVVAC